MTDPLRLRRQRRIVWYIALALLISGILLSDIGFQNAGAMAYLLIFPAMLYALLLGYRIGRVADIHAADQNNPQPCSKMLNWRVLLGKLIFAGLVFFVSEASMLVAGAAALVVMFVLLPMALNAGAYRCQRRMRLLIYALAVSAGWLIGHQEVENERHNFDRIIAAVDRFHAIEKRYPDTLGQLVPAYLPSVPSGRNGKFIYHAAPGNADAHLSHMPEPFIHESYDFNSKKRRTWD